MSHGYKAWTLGAFCAFYAAGYVNAQDLNKLSAAESATGWKLLWDGTAGNKSQFLQSGSSGSANTWVIDDNALLDPNSPSPDAFLFTKENYSNFEFSVEWKITAGGNSGIFPRQNVRSGYCATYEFGILDDFSTHGDADDVLKNPGETTLWSKRTATVYDMYPTTENGVLPSAGGKQVSATKPAGQWNQGIIFANGNFVEHWLNGQKVTDFEIGSTEWNARFAKSKFPGDFGCQVGTYGKAATGMIGFQDHGGNLRIWLRNIKIRTFTPAEKLPTPYIHPATAAKGSVVIKISPAVAGAVIRYTVDGSTPTDVSPIFKDSLVVTKNTTLRAISTRPRFPASDVATGTFTVDPTGIATGSASYADNRVDLSRTREGLRFRNLDGSHFDVDILTVDGGKAASFRVDRPVINHGLKGFKAGVYLVRMHAGAWMQSKLILID